MTVKPAWAEKIKPEIFNKMRDEILFTPDIAHTEHLIDHLVFCAFHPNTPFDVTFYLREPILETTLEGRFARRFRSACERKRSTQRDTYRDVQRFEKLLRNVVLSDGTVIDAPIEIWTIKYMPANLDISNIDLSQSEEIAGFGGETIRQMISNTYHCRSRVEEDLFLARWIAS